MNGYERIKELYLKTESKNPSLIKIVRFLMTKQAMNDFYLNETKNLEEMMSYINRIAKNQAVNNVAVLTDEEVYQLAIKYFSTDDEELGIVKSDDKKVEQKEESKSNENKNQLTLEI